MRISVCIPTVRPDTVASAISSIKRQTHRDWDLLVVGQGEERPLRRVVEEAAGRDDCVRYVHVSQRGASIARNAALRESDGEVVAFLDDDCEAREDWLAVIDASFAEFPELGLVGGSLLAPASVEQFLTFCPSIEPTEALYDPKSSQNQPPQGWTWVTANFAIRRSLALQVGPLDEHLGAGTHFAAAEDTDYLLRLEALGAKMLSTPRAVVYHTHGTRRGLSAVYNHKRNYARGNGALAAKLTLLGDPRGRQWVRDNWYDATIGRLRSKRAHELPLSLLRLYHYMQAYRECLSSYRAELLPGEDGNVSAVLRPANGLGQEG